jgi:predicted transcriptional regulator of viral defense system
MKLEERLLRSVKQRASDVILRAELVKMGSSSQLSEALKALQDKGVLVRIGTGVYARTRRSSVTGAVIPAGSLETLATEALKKMGVAVKASKAAVEYNSRRTTQLPGTFVANTGRRKIRRKIAVGGRSVVYENDYSGSKASA